MIVCLPLMLAPEDLSLPATTSIFTEDLAEGGVHITSKIPELLLKDRRVLAYRLDAVEESADKLLLQKGQATDPHVKHILVANRDRPTLINYLKALIGPVARNPNAVKVGSKDEVIRKINNKESVRKVTKANDEEIKGTREEAKIEEAPRRIVSTTPPPLYIGIIFSEDYILKELLLSQLTRV